MTWLDLTWNFLESAMTWLDLTWGEKSLTCPSLYEYDKTIFNNDNDPFVSILKLRKFQGIKSSDQDVQFLTIKILKRLLRKRFNV